MASRFRFAGVITLLLTFAVIPLMPAGSAQVAAQEQQSNIVDQFAGIDLPPDMGQADFQVYVSATKHTIRGQMLDYWRANGATSVYGNPVSEPFAAANGLYSQAFERGVFQYLPEFLWTEDPDVRLMPISETILNERVGNLRRDGRRDLGGGDRRDYAWRPVAPDGNSAARAISEGGIYAEATAHTMTGKILDWYNDHEGFFYLGNPVSQPVQERGMLVQYFDGGAIMHSPTRTKLVPLVAEHADHLDIDTSAVDRNGLPEFDESLFLTKPNPNPIGDLGAAGRKHIEISISQQSLWAYQGSTLVAQTLVSTGLAPNETEVGLFHVRYKLPKQDMAGFTSNTGEVVGFGEDDAPDGTTTYEVKDVPNVMYINMDAEALHGAYWHNNFGNRMSHGCINLPLAFADFLYGWAPLGTMVHVYP
jgi:hypothetical protein